MSWNRLISLMILVTTLSVGGDIAVAEEPVERFLVRCARRLFTFGGNLPRCSGLCRFDPGIAERGHSAREIASASRLSQRCDLRMNGQSGRRKSKRVSTNSWKRTQRIQGEAKLASN